MAKNYRPLSGLLGTDDNGIEWRMTVPEFVDADRIIVSEDRINRAARKAGASTLAIASEAGPISERSYGVSMGDDDWAPGLGNIESRTKKVPLSRAALSQRGDRTIDWVVINNSEVTDRYQGIDHIPRAFVRIKPQIIEVTTVEPYVLWAEFLDQAVHHGVNDLARVKAGLNPLTQLRRLTTASVASVNFIKALV